MGRAGRHDAFSSDEELLAAYSRGSTAAAREIMDRHATGVLRLAAGMLGNRADAEDVTQEVMLRLWKIAPDWRAGRAKVSTWLWRVTVNLCMDRLRRAGRTRPAPDADPVDDGPAPAERLMEEERVKALYRGLAELPERQRTAVVLRHMEGMSNPDIAETLETSVEAVESLLTRGMRELRLRLGPRRDELGWKA